MKFLDKIALNRLLAIITSFILSLIKLFDKNIDSDTDSPTTKRKSIIDRLKNLKNKKHE